MGMLKSLQLLKEELQKKSLDKYFDIEMPVNDYTFVTKYGDLVSVFELNGLTTLILGNVLDETASKIDRYFYSILKEGQHTIDWNFERDKSRTRREIRSAMLRDRETVKRLNLDGMDIMQENEDINTALCVYQKSHLVLWTHVSALDERSLSIDSARNRKLVERFNVRLDGAPNPFKLVPKLVGKHEKRLEELKQCFEDAKTKARLLHIKEAATTMALQADPLGHDDSYVPQFPFDKQEYQRTAKDYNLHLVRKPYAEDPVQSFSNFCPDHFAKQVCAQPVNEYEAGMIKIGTTYQCPMLMRVFPREDSSFLAWLAEIDKQVPIRINFRLTDGKDTMFEFKKAFAALVRWGHPDNKTFSSAASKRSVEMASKIAYCGLQISATTWANDPDSALANRETLMRATNRWSQAKLTADLGDPTETYVSTIIGGTKTNPGVTAFPPLRSAIELLPIVQTGRIWNYSSLIFRTLTDVIYPFEVAARNQNSHMDLFIAPPRQGKSVMANAINKALIEKAGNRQLPYITICDIGPTSVGLGRCIQDMLSEKDKSKVVFHTFNINQKEKINPFDIQFGLTEPLAEEHSFMARVLRIFCTDDNTGDIPSNCEGLINKVIRVTFAKGKDIRSPKRYVPGVDKEADELIIQHQLEVNEDTTQFELRDILFKAGALAAAKRAHYRAMPLIDDFIDVASTTTEIQKDYSIPVGNSDKFTVIDYFVLKLKEAVDKYKLFNGHTMLDFESARVVIMDLKAVVPTGAMSNSGHSPEAQQAGLFYMVARNLGARNYFLRSSMEDGHLPFWPELYRAYQRKRIEQIEQLPKRLQYDEYHCTNGCYGFRAQVAYDGKEGPKWGLSQAIISQAPSDFDDALFELYTNLFVFGGLEKNAIDYLSKKVQLSEAAVDAMANWLHGPRKGGSCFLLQSKIDQKVFSQILRFAKGPLELWSMTTQKEDRPIREALIHKLGAKQARWLLSKVFPKSTAVDWLQHREHMLEGKTQEMNKEQLEDTLSAECIEMLMRKYQDHLEGENVSEQLQ